MNKDIQTIDETTRVDLGQNELMNMSYKMSVEQVRKILKDNRYQIANENNESDGKIAIKLTTGCIINCWSTGTVHIQGKQTEEITRLFNKADANNEINKRVFVVYGHDNNARTQLEAILRRWDLEPLILDQLASSGQTIIEKLEENINKASFGIVLATPDDIGYPRNSECQKMYRARQNVVLELGMLLARFGRDKVVILLSQSEENMEKPSDIDGLLYIPFKDNVEEAKLSLAKELHSNGYDISLNTL